MAIFRVIAFFYIVFCVLNAIRALMASLPQNGEAPPRTRGRHTPPPFGGFDGEGPFGPFGPFGPRAQHQQRPFEQAYQRPYEPPRQPPPSRPREKSPYEILGVPPGASSSEIRRAYQTKVRQYHPDRTGDLAPELRELAEQRTKEITNAYNQLKRQG